MHKIFTLFFLFSPIFLFAQTDTAHIFLQEGTIVKVALLNDLNGKDLSVGQVLNMELSEDIVVNGVPTVKKGARVTGTVTDAERSKSLGKKGRLSFSIDYLYLPDGRTVKLRNQVAKNLAGSGAEVVAGAVLLSPVALLIPGKNAKFYKGDVFTAYIDKNVSR